MDTEVDDNAGAYLTCPLQVDPQVDAGMKRSADPESKSMSTMVRGLPIETFPVDCSKVISTQGTVHIYNVT